MQLAMSLQLLEQLSLLIQQDQQLPLLVITQLLLRQVLPILMQVLLLMVVKLSQLQEQSIPQLLVLTH